MKTLLLLRHGKAEDSSPRGDIGRELTHRGRKDAGSIGKQLKHEKIHPDIIVSSGAARADETAAIVAEALRIIQPIVIEPAIYEAEQETLLEIVRNLPDSVSTALLVGHNPGFSALTAALAASGTLPPQMSTANLARLDFEADRWADVQLSTGVLVCVYKPA